jgi:hypothetical protein
VTGEATSVTIRQIQALIRLLDAQSGKSITAGTAANLIADVQRILAVLGA